MDNRIIEWIEVHGRRLAELKIIGGEEFFVKGERNVLKLDNLSGEEWIEFFTLVGQLDGLIWAFEPDDPARAKKFHRELTRRMNKMEKHCRHVLKITGRLDIQKGEA